MTKAGIVILSAAKDLLWGNAQILHSAQDDNTKACSALVGFYLVCRPTTINR